MVGAVVHRGMMVALPEHIDWGMWDLLPQVSEVPAR